MASYNLTRSIDGLLESTISSPPSFTVHLHPDYWTLNSGLKFLYNNQIASLLDDIRAHRIPVDFLELFDFARVPFYDGCMIAELLDYRPQKNKESILERPERSRVVLHPDSESLWADVCLLNQKNGNIWTDAQALEIESRILLATSPPLCLDPDPHLSRIANHILRVSTPTAPSCLKRKAAALDLEEDETGKARRAKIMQFMDPRANRSHVPSYRILDAIKRAKALRPVVPPPPSQMVMQLQIQPPKQQQQHPGQSLIQSQAYSQAQSVPPPSQSQVHSYQAVYPNQQPPAAMAQPPTNQPSAVPAPLQTPSSLGGEKKPKQTKKKADPSQSPYMVSDRGTATPTPAPQPVANQFQVTHPALPPQPQQHTQHQAASFQPSIPPPNFLNQPPIRNAQAKDQPVPHSTPKPMNKVPPQQPNQQPMQPSLAQLQMAQAQAQAQAQVQAQMQMYAQIQQQQQSNIAQQQQRLNSPQNQTGRVTPQTVPLSRTPVNNVAQGGPVRGSPLVINQPLVSRSPMPPNTQPTATPMAHPQHSNYAVTQGQYNAQHLRAMGLPTGSQHIQGVPAHMNNGMMNVPAAATMGQHPQPDPNQAAHMMQYPMYSYAQMGMSGYGRLPTGYSWPTMMGRGVPGAVNGQHMSGMVPLNQQIGKTVPSNHPGR